MTETSVYFIVLVFFLNSMVGLPLSYFLNRTLILMEKYFQLFARYFTPFSMATIQNIPPYLFKIGWSQFRIFSLKL